MIGEPGLGGLLRFEEPTEPLPLVIAKPVNDPTIRFPGTAADSGVCDARHGIVMNRKAPFVDFIWHLSGTAAKVPPRFLLPQVL
jgi:hypothetical protein